MWLSGPGLESRPRHFFFLPLLTTPGGAQAMGNPLVQKPSRKSEGWSRKEEKSEIAKSLPSFFCSPPSLFFSLSLPINHYPLHSLHLTGFSFSQLHGQQKFTVADFPTLSDCSTMASPVHLCGIGHLSFHSLSSKKKENKREKWGE